MYADTQLAQAELNWSSQTTVEQMCKLIVFIIGRMLKQGSLLSGEDFWNWQTMNPEGYNNIPHGSPNGMQA